MISECRIDLWQLRSHSTRSPRADHAVPDDLVRGRGAADHEQRFVRAEDARRVALARGDRPGVVEQRAELCRPTPKCRSAACSRRRTRRTAGPTGLLRNADAAAVAGRVPGVAGVQRVIHQRLEHRRRQALEVELRRARDGAGQELGRVLEQAHEGVRVLQHARRHHLRGALVAEQEDRQPVVAAALGGQHLLEDLPLRRGGLRAVDGDEPARFGVEDVDQPPRVLVAEAGDHAKSFLLDRGGKLPHAAPGGVLAFVVLVDDGDREMPAGIPCVSSAARLELVLPGKLDAHVVGRLAVELLELAPQQLDAASARS